MLEILLTLSGLYALLFFLAIYLEDNSIVDVFWGIGFMIISMMSLFMLETANLAQMVLSCLILLWGTRLTVYIGRKQLSHSGEDARYALWRKTWKCFYLRSFFQIYILQGLLMCLIAAPIFIINFSVNPEYTLSITMFGALIALLGLAYESLADLQLSRFMKIKKKGQILTSGLRKYSRYPQYFGESVFWLGICIIASQVSILAFGSWLLITLLVRYVSGVPMLESRYKGNTEYEKYSKKTPIFIPHFKK